MTESAIAISLRLGGNGELTDATERLEALTHFAETLDLVVTEAAAGIHANEPSPPADTSGGHTKGVR